MWEATRRRRNSLQAQEEARLIYVMLNKDLAVHLNAASAYLWGYGECASEVVLEWYSASFSFVAPGWVPLCITFDDSKWNFNMEYNWLWLINATFNWYCFVSLVSHSFYAALIDCSVIVLFICSSLIICLLQQQGLNPHGQSNPSSSSLGWQQRKVGRECGLWGGEAVPGWHSDRAQIRPNAKWH